MTHADLEAVNTPSEPDKVAPRPGSGLTIDDEGLHAQFPPYSYQMIRLSLGAAA